ncbi:MAG: hypothetical protein Alpg2KO_22410 [Alphaproteobacteria bacterium]
MYQDPTTPPVETATGKDVQGDGPAPQDVNAGKAGPTPPVPYLENDTLKNRLVALTYQRFSLMTIAGGSRRVFARAMKRLAAPVTRNFVLPGEKNQAVQDAKRMLATLPKGTTGLFRTDGSLIVGSSTEAPLKAARDRKMDLSNVYLVRANLDDRALRGISMPGADMRLGQLKQTGFDQATLDRADMRRAKLHYTKLAEASLQSCDLREASVIGIKAEVANFSGCDFTDARIEAGTFKDANLAGADFTRTRFVATSEYDHYRERSYETKIDFSGADLTGARFDATANFDSMILTNAKLDGVIIQDRHGNAIEGASLNHDGSILYTKIPAPPQPAVPALPGPGGRP